MCNPRRVHVTASRQLVEAWEHEIRRVITRSGNVTGEARSREPLDASIGAPTLALLERVLEAAEGWERDGDAYTHELDGGYVTYHADTQELEIVARVTEEVTADGSSSATMRGDLDQQVEVNGVGVYYDDNWGGITEEDARAAAGRDAEQRLDAARRDLMAAARTEVERAHGAAVEAAASAEAEAELARRSEARAEQLRVDAARRLTAVGIQGRNTFHQALANAYRDAILAYAQSRHAEGISCIERDGVMEIEFELQT
jgi:hypothetical protein